jgi:hypothetical protein
VPTTSSERTGVLIIRAWVEGDPPTLRLRITRTDDLTAGDEESTVTASVEEAVDVVRRWLEGFARGDEVVT